MNQVSNAVSIEDAEQLFSSIKIPARPNILNEFMCEINKRDPELSKIATIISKDIALSAGMLKLVNSSAFGLLRKIDSPQAAVMTLGITNISCLVTGLSLKRSLNSGQKLERFWDSSDRVAKISMSLANKLRFVPRELAYLHGLFRDCGMPVMLQKYPDYIETLQQANIERNYLFTKVEDDRHTTNHALIGYLLAKNWGLPDAVCIAIQNHHEVSVLKNDSLPVHSMGLIAISYLAEYLSDYIRMRGDHLWQENGSIVMQYLGLTEFDIEDIKEEVFQEYA